MNQPIAGVSCGPLARLELLLPLLLPSLLVECAKIFGDNPLGVLGVSGPLALEQPDLLGVSGPLALEQTDLGVKMSGRVQLPKLRGDRCLSSSTLNARHSRSCFQLPSCWSRALIVLLRIHWEWKCCQQR